METSSISNLRTHCDELIEKVASTGKPLCITRRGVAAVMIVPLPPSEKSKGWRLGLFHDQCEIIGDLVAPLDVTWEAIS